MADTQRSKTAILALFADNVTGQISAQDLRDMVVTIMEDEFANAGDFWAQPQGKYTQTDGSARGYRMYSQYAGSALVFGEICFLEESTGQWMRACASDSQMNGFLGMAMGTYGAGDADAEMLIEGIVYDTVTYSALFSMSLGRPVFLASDGASIGEVNMDSGTSAVLIGYVMPNSDVASDSISSKFYFRPSDWAITGT